MVFKQTLLAALILVVFFAILPGAARAGAPEGATGSEEAVCIVEPEDLDCSPYLFQVNECLKAQFALFSRTDPRRRLHFSFLVLIPVLPAPQQTDATCKCGDDLTLHSPFADRKFQRSDEPPQNLLDHHLSTQSPSLFQLHTALLC